MAKRYSGDAEIRVSYDAKKKVYHGAVRDPKHRWEGTMKAPPHQGGPQCSEAYDKAAKAFLLRAQRWARGRLLVETKDGVVRVRRIFESPCPIGMSS